MTKETRTDLLDGETPEDAKPQTTPQEVEPAPETPAIEPDGEFDKDRAMSTIKTLREIEKQAKKDKAELEKLKAAEQKRKEAEMSETEKLKAQADEATARAAQLEAELLRRDVIAETGLPAVLAERLKGTTKEEMLADAEELKKSLPLAKSPPHVPANDPPDGQKKETREQARARVMGIKGNYFDNPVETFEKQGGGVVWNTDQTD